MGELLEWPTPEFLRETLGQPRPVPCQPDPFDGAVAGARTPRQRRRRRIGSSMAMTSTDAAAAHSCGWPGAGRAGIGRTKRAGAGGGAPPGSPHRRGRPGPSAPACAAAWSGGPRAGSRDPGRPSPARGALPGHGRRRRGRPRSAGGATLWGRGGSRRRTRSRGTRTVDRRAASSGPCAGRTRPPTPTRAQSSDEAQSSDAPEQYAPQRSITSRRRSKRVPLAYAASTGFRTVCPRARSATSRSIPESPHQTRNELRNP